MNIKPYVENIHRQLEGAAEAAGEEARALAERLAAPLESAIRLTLQDALAAAAEEITTELAPGSVELRLRGREPEFVVTAAPGDLVEDQAAASGPQPEPASVGDDRGSVSRINLRLPERLKGRIERAAGEEGLSVNAWLVQAAAGALERSGAGGRRAGRAAQGGQRYTGWAR